MHRTVMQRISTLNFRQWGEAQGPKVVLIHGLFGDLDNLGQAARALAARFTVITPDLRNHGASAHHGQMQLATLADDLGQLLTQQVPDPAEAVHLVGHSLGGKVAMQFALRHPERVKSLTVVDMAPVAYSQPRHSQVFAALNAVERAAPSDRRSAEALMSPYLPDSGVRQFLLKGFLRPEARQLAGTLSCWRFNLAAIEAAYPDLMGWEPVSGPYAGPTLFIKGGNSDYLTAEHQGRIMALFPAARARVVAGAGHWLHAEQPQLFERMLADFLAGAR